MPITAIAPAAGYASLRRFNAAFLETYGKAPRDIRRSLAGSATTDELALRLPFRPPYDFAHLLWFLEKRVIPGVEVVEGTTYRRSFVAAGSPGWLSIAPIDGESALALRVHHAKPSALGEIVTRVKRMFDVDADPLAIHTHLRGDALLKPLVKRWPGQRLPNAWDGFELAVRAILGQQVSVAAARTLAQRLVQRFGVAVGAGDDAEAVRLFPEPATLADADLTAIGLTRQRAETLRTVARAICDGRVGFGPEQTLDRFVASWVELPGIGAWTAHYMAMRARSEPDAFPAADLVLLKAVVEAGAKLTPRALEARAEAWRPWRAYAVMHLWRNA